MAHVLRRNKDRKSDQSRQVGVQQCCAPRGTNRRRNGKMKCEGIVRLLLLIAAGSPVVALAQNKVSVAERLGFGSDGKLLIVHADDVGMTHAVNAATIKELESGGGEAARTKGPCAGCPESTGHPRTHIRWHV